MQAVAKVQGRDDQAAHLGLPRQFLVRHAKRNFDAAIPVQIPEHTRPAHLRATCCDQLLHTTIGVRDVVKTFQASVACRASTQSDEVQPSLRSSTLRLSRANVEVN